MLAILTCKRHLLIIVLLCTCRTDCIKKTSFYRLKNVLLLILQPNVLFLFCDVKYVLLSAFLLYKCRTGGLKDAFLSSINVLSTTFFILYQLKRCPFVIFLCVKYAMFVILLRIKDFFLSLFYTVNIELMFNKTPFLI